MVGTLGTSNFSFEVSFTFPGRPGESWSNDRRCLFTKRCSDTQQRLHSRTMRKLQTTLINEGRIDLARHPWWQATDILQPIPGPPFDGTAVNPTYYIWSELIYFYVLFTCLIQTSGTTYKYRQMVRGWYIIKNKKEITATEKTVLYRKCSDSIRHCMHPRRPHMKTFTDTYMYQQPMTRVNFLNDAQRNNVFWIYTARRSVSKKYQCRKNDQRFPI